MDLNKLVSYSKVIERTWNMKVIFYPAFPGKNFKKREKEKKCFSSIQSNYRKIRKMSKISKKCEFKIE